MKRMRFCVFLCCLSVFWGLKAQETGPLPGSPVAEETRVFSLAPLMGTDVGGAVPVPFNAIGGQFNAFPRVNPTLGALLKFRCDPRWELVTGLSYKTVAMDADARVTNQKFKGEDMIQYVTGTARMQMSFTLLELPLYVSWHFGKEGRNALLAGPYGAYVFSAKFVTEATKGFMGTAPDLVESHLTEPMTMDFTEVLDSWDLGFALGYERQVYKKVHLGLKFCVGLRDIFVPGSDFFDYKMFPMRGSLTLSYDLFDL